MQPFSIQGGCNRLPCCDFSFGLLTSRNATKMGVHTFSLSRVKLADCLYVTDLAVHMLDSSEVDDST